MWYVNAAQKENKYIYIYMMLERSKERRIKKKWDRKKEREMNERRNKKDAECACIMHAI